jgi:hypothetical protein
VHYVLAADSVQNTFSVELSAFAANNVGIKWQVYLISQIISYSDVLHKII